MTEQLLKYFNGDELSASVWLGKYALKDNEGSIVEATPEDMHWRMAREFARADYKYVTEEANNENFENLSSFGKELVGSLSVQNEEELAAFYFAYMNRFKYIIPQGSIMSALGNPYKLQSLSNCFVLPSPYDSYGGIFKTDQEVAQLEKRRGGVGLNINPLRPEDVVVANAAGTSTGAHSFMDRFSNTTREVAQNGRRGALMLLMSILHPDIIKFITKKKDRTKVTGANVSVQLNDLFMKAVDNEQDFMCRFPIDMPDNVIPPFNTLDYEKLVRIEYADGETVKEGFLMKVRAQKVFDLIVEMAWENAEPGVAFMDRVTNYSPEGVYPLLRAIASNPCGEQWMQAYDACRLLATNLFSFVVNPYTYRAYIDFDRMYDVFYMQQRMADLVVDLEVEYVNRIIAKIDSDPEPEEVKAVERNLWVKVRDTAQASRRTGCGFTAMADMIAAMNFRYDSSKAMDMMKEVMKTKMRAELDCMTDLAILRGSFDGYNRDLELEAYELVGEYGTVTGIPNSYRGRNDFYKMLVEEFPEQVDRMYKYGRRNISWSTVAPTGSVSIIAILTEYSNTSGGIEPVFMPYYFRNKKVNPSDKGVRVDFVDQNGDAWQQFPVIMGGFKEWFKAYHEENNMEFDLSSMTKDDLDAYFEESPYYQSCANDIRWYRRIDMQSIIQRYTTNAISSTLNLPKDVSKETVADIYYHAYDAGLKGVTIYRDGCRTGVLVSDNSDKDGEIVYHDAPKRPEVLHAELHSVTVKGERYGVVVGLLKGKLYEIFAFQDTEKAFTGRTKGRIVKGKKNVYTFFTNEETVIVDLGKKAVHADEQMLTRLLSGMLRHGIKPKYIYQQIDKCPLEVVSFGTALKRVLKKYISDSDLIEGQKCSDCGSTNIRIEEGCSKCLDCGSSKCG